MKKLLVVLIVALATIALFVGCKQNPKVNPKTQTYKVGDTGPAGGIIFYVNSNADKDGWTYLEAAPSDLTVTYKWSTESSISFITETDIGKGKSNTDKLKEVGIDKFPAAEACTKYTNKGYSDWFLPSKDELNLMYTNLKSEGKGTWQNGGYWSSSADDSTSAWRVFFETGGYNLTGLDATHYVRPVRAF